MRYTARVSDCLEGQLTTALVPTLSHLCFLVLSAKITKVREMFFLINFVLFHFVVGKLLEVNGWVSHGLVLP